MGKSDPPDFCLVDLSQNNRRFCHEHANFHDPDFAPSGSTLVAATPYSGQHEIWKVTVQNDGSLRELVQLTRGAEGQPARGASWSADGEWVIFQRDVAAGDGEDWRLYIVRADGSSLRSLNVAGKQPTWNGGGIAPSPTPNVLTETVYLPVVQK